MDLKDTLTLLGLPSASASLEKVLEMAAGQQVTYSEFLADLLRVEQTERRTRYLTTRTQLANLPFKKTLDDFDFGLQPSLDERQIRELANLSFVQQAANVLLLGPPGVGKSHLAVALGLLAIEQGHSVYFTTTHKLAHELMSGYQENRIRRKMRRYLAPKVLIIDEMGYQPFPVQAANLFFQLISARYERSSTIITSNKSFSDWGDVLGDPVIATAILDRLLHHAYVINIRGESFRLKERKAAGLYQGPILRPAPISTSCDIQNNDDI